MVLASYNQDLICIVSLLTYIKKYPSTSDVSSCCVFPVTEIRVSWLAVRTRGLVLSRGSGESFIHYMNVRLTATAYPYKIVSLLLLRLFCTRMNNRLPETWVDEKYLAHAYRPRYVSRRGGVWCCAVDCWL